MKLMTKEIQKNLPKLYETEDIKTSDKKAYVKYFCPWNQWTWYGMEFDGKDTFFGYVIGHEKEYGYFTLSELKSVKGFMGLGIERDLHFKPKPIKEIINN